MALRFSCKSAAVAVAGTTFTHGIATAGGTATTPDEWSFNHRGAPPAGNANTLYLVSVGSTTLVVASASGATTADVFAALNHSQVS